MTHLSALEKGRLEIHHRRHSSMDAGIQSQGGGLNTIRGSGLRHPCRNDVLHEFQPAALCAAHVHHTAPLVYPEPALLSDEQLEYYGTVFERLNARYALTRHHQFAFEDFLDSPDTFEIAIQLYFANKSLFENRRAGGKIHLHTYLRYPELLEVTLSVEEAYREAAAVRCEQLLPKQVMAAQKINVTEMAWFQELIARTFERQHRVLLRGSALVEPNTHYHRRKRKKAGGH